MSTNENENVEAEQLALYAGEWAVCNGLLVKSVDYSSWQHVAFSLMPRKIPNQAMNLMSSLMVPFNSLVDSISRDHSWLFETLETTARVDAFTGSLMKIAKQVAHEGINQPMSLGIHRSDYMLHHDPDAEDHMARPLQVELNTIASSFGCLCTGVSRWHARMRDQFGNQYQLLKKYFTDDCVSSENNVALHMCHGIQAAHNNFVTNHVGLQAKPVVVLFVVQPNERNLMDQRILEHLLWTSSSIQVVRKSLAEIADCCYLEDGTNLLLLKESSEKQFTVSTVYFRAGYDPKDYPTESEWKARLLMEQSMAIKCPNIFYQLVGAKKVQQVLAKPGQLEHFIDDDEAQALRSCFAGLWSLDKAETDADTQAAIEDAVKNYDSYVMKPQREGGGNNIFGEDLARALTEMSDDELSAYILMERIRPRVREAYFVKGSKATLVSAIAEVGIFGVYLGGGSTVVANELAGHLVRTKAADINEGGVATGYAVVDSAVLTST